MCQSEFKTDDPTSGRVPRALEPWRTKAYLKYVAVRRGEGNAVYA